MHLARLDVLGQAVWEVLKDVLEMDLNLIAGGQTAKDQPGVNVNGDASVGRRGNAEGRRRTFVAGQSLGGFVAVDVCRRFGGSVDPTEPLIAGVRPILSLLLAAKSC